MHQINDRLKRLLEERSVPYDEIEHRRDYTAQETAADTRTLGRDFAKTVILLAEGSFIMAVLPAHHMVELRRLRDELGVRELRFAREDELRLLFPDCETGAEPPFGNLYSMPVYLSSAFKGDGTLTFNAGSHEEAVRISRQHYVSLVHPRVMDFSLPVGTSHISWH